MKNPYDYYLEWDARFWEAPFLFGLSRVGHGLAGKRLLDIGSRRGRMCLWFAEEGARVVGGDLHYDYLTYAAAESRKNGGEAFSLVQMRAEALPFRDGAVDVIFTKSAFVLFKKAAAFREMLRVLKPGGYVWLVENMKLNPFAALVRLVRRLAGVEWVKRAAYVTYEELESYAPAFSRYAHGEFHLLTPLCRVIPLPRPLLRRLVAWESRILRRSRWLSRFAWLTCVVGQK
ncbi:MAG: methyltransferase domain-containing protein [candidate division Zixibacteria bacterium]|nr:methyltransferase domain-containing protein [candidate division Zixibacteria bacterium]